MKKVIGAVALSTVMFAGAALANDTLEATFGNTVNGVLADGTQVASYHVNADNTVSITSAEGTVDGTWRTENNQICLTLGDAPEACSDLVDGLGVGDSWTAPTADGVEVTYTIVAGR